jgi:hypothetical protein
MNPLLILGGLAALYTLFFSGESEDEQNPAGKNRSSDGNHNRSELSATPPNVDGGKGGITPDPKPTIEPTQE